MKFNIVQCAWKKCGLRFPIGKAVFADGKYFCSHDCHSAYMAKDKQKIEVEPIGRRPFTNPGFKIA